MKIGVIGLGYVGLANAILLAQHNEVVVVDIVKEKVDLVNAKKSPINDKEIEMYLASKPLNLIATLDEAVAIKDAQFVIIATPTNYDEELHYFDVSTVENAIIKVYEINPKATIVIKSTIPIGFTKQIREKLNIENIIFSPEFLREGSALLDNLHPSRIVVGANHQMKEQGKEFAQLLLQGALDEAVEIIIANETEAEAIKLFSNTYLAMRVSFFNELDTFAALNELDAYQIIHGMSLDKRIGNIYNNPSFGYGGYCLPKDSKQLARVYDRVPNNLINSIVLANDTRKNFIVDQILAKKCKTVGVYRLIAKKETDNFRESAVLDIIKRLRVENLNVIIYEPSFQDNYFMEYKVDNDFEKFKAISDLILANRYEDELEDVLDKVYTRDIYFRD